jgi:hypothetical protein
MDLDRDRNAHAAPRESDRDGRGDRQSRVHEGDLDVPITVGTLGQR